MSKKAQPQDDFADLYRQIRAQMMKGIFKAELRHLRLGRGGDGADQIVHVWAEDDFKGLSPDEFSKKVVDEVDEDCKIFPAGQYQRYGLFIWQRDTTQHSHRIFVQMRGGGPTDDGDVLGSEPPNAEGRMSQIMRHDEAHTRLNITSTQRTIDTMFKQLERQDATINRLLDQFMPVLQAVQQITLRTAEADFNLERRRKLWELVDKSGEKLLPMAPIAAAALVKDKHPDMAKMLVNLVTNPSESILDLFLKDVESLGPEKAQEVLKSLGSLPHGNAIIQALMALAEQKKQAQTPQSQAPNNGKAE